MRVAGVPVGKVRKVEVGDGTNRTVATVELERRYAPLRSDARAILRQKTLLGETYVELTPGTLGEDDPRGRRSCPTGQVKPTVQLDEIFDSLDPETRAAFKGWQTELAKGIKGRGRDFNDALGTLPGFASDGADVLEVLDTQEGAVQRLVKNTGVVFGALTENEAQLRNLITGSKRTFDATASKNDELAETIRIFPTFLEESKLTLARVQRFSTRHRPADHRPAPGRPRPAADAARRARAGARPRALLREPRPGDHGVQDRPAGHARGARGRGAAARRARPVPRADQPDLQVLRGLAVAGRRLPQLRRRRAVGQDGVARRRHRPLPAPVRPARRRERRDLAGARAEQPRQLLLPAAQHRRVEGRTPARPTTSTRSRASSTARTRARSRRRRTARPAASSRTRTRSTPGYKFSFNGKKLQGAFPHVEADDYSQPGSGASAQANR